MFRTIIIAIILMLSSVSCSLNDDKDKGTITGTDIRECACCGGYFIEINNQTYRFFELPKETDFTLENAVFPIHVELDWSMEKNPCLGDEIIITDIEKTGN